MYTNKPMYTYEDFERKAEEYGFTPDQISDADRQLARNNADAGIALLGFKNDWINATNDSARAMAHAGAEDIRSRYGSYTGGANGGSFVPTGTAEYEDPWEGALQSTIRRLENRKFEWSPETDPTAKYYEDMYRREGERAMKDTLGAVAATTGGIPSSYATAAAAQQRNYYARQLTDKYPELYRQAYENFLAEYDRDYQMLDAYSNLSDTEYSRWFDQQELDRQARQDSFAAAQQAFENMIIKDELDLKIRELDASERQAAEELAYKYAELEASGKQADAELQYKYAALSQQAKEIVQEYAYKYASLDESKRQYDLSLEQQLIIAEMEDRLARDKITANQDAEKLEMATVAASYGDFSALKALGYDVSAYEAIYNKKMAEELDSTTEEEGSEKDVINDMAGQAGTVTGGEVFNTPKEQSPVFIESPGSAPMMVTGSVVDNRHETANAGKSDTEIAAENENTKNEMKDQQKPDALYERFLNGGYLYPSELDIIKEKYGAEMQSPQVLYRRYQRGGTLTAAEKQIVEKAYGKNVFKYGDTYGMK